MHRFLCKQPVSAFSIAARVRAIAFGLFGLVALLALGQHPVWAALGDKPLPVGPQVGASSSANSGGASGSASNGVLVTLRSQEAVMASSGPAAVLYTVQTVSLETGTTVTEYVAPSGVVFAVRWSGRVLPDYALVLGVHFQTFKTAALADRQNGRRGGSVGVNVNGLVVGSSGHMGAYQGYAYVASLVPAGVDIQGLLL